MVEDRHDCCQLSDVYLVCADKPGFALVRLELKLFLLPYGVVVFRLQGRDALLNIMQCRNGCIEDLLCLGEFLLGNAQCLALWGD